MSAIHAATAPELTLLRAKKQSCEIYAAILTSPIVAAAQVDGTPTSNDMVKTIGYRDATLGDETVIKADQTLFVGSAAGLYDIGQARLRSAVAGTLTIGETSEIDWADGQHLSAVMDFAIWQKQITVEPDGTALMDGDIAYTDQNANHSPICIMGTHAIKELTGATVSTAWDASDSWVPGSTVTGYAWNCVGGTIDDAAIANPNISFAATGKYLIECTVTAANGKTATGRRGAQIYAKRNVYGAGVATVSRARSANVATLVTATHGLSNGDTIQVGFLSGTGYNLVDVVVTVVNGTTFTYPCSGANETTAADTGGYIYKRLHVASLPSKVQLNNLSGDYQRGGWEFSIRMYTGASTTDIRDRALVVLFAEDYYDGVLGSVGQIADRENVLAVGWINGESIVADILGGYVEFTCSGPQYWLGDETAFPLGIENCTTTPAAWTEMQDLTIDKMIANFATWRSTLAAVCDVYPSNDTRISPACKAPSGSLWSQLTEFTERQILAHPCSDQFGRVFCEVDTNYLPLADRAGIPVVMTLAKGDITGEINFERIATPVCSRLALSGISIPSGSNDPSTYFSLSPGHVFKHFGTPEQIDQLLLSTQAQSNSLSGLILGQRNNQYPRIDVSFSQNNRMIGVCPRQYLGVPQVSGFTPRGLSYSGNIIPRTVNINSQGGSLIISLTCEAETFEDISVNGDIPVDPSGGVVSTNAIGATGLHRVAEAAIQIRGDGGERQVHKDVKLALAYAQGADQFCTMSLLSKSL